MLFSILKKHVLDQVKVIAHSFIFIQQLFFECLLYARYFPGIMKVKLLSCVRLCNPVDCSPPGSSIHGILQARILEWVAISSSRGSSQPRDPTQVSRNAGRCFNLWATREVSAACILKLEWYREGIMRQTKYSKSLPHILRMISSLTLLWPSIPAWILQFAQSEG